MNHRAGRGGLAGPLFVVAAGVAGLAALWTHQPPPVIPPDHPPVVVAEP